MIGPNRGDIGKPLTEPALFFPGAERRRALRDRAEPFHVFFSQHQIMRAGFAGDIESAGARLGDERDATAATDVNDVQTAARFGGKFDRVTDRLEFGGDWARVQVIADTTLASGARGGQKRSP